MLLKRLRIWDFKLEDCKMFVCQPRSAQVIHNAMTVQFKQ